MKINLSANSKRIGIFLGVERHTGGMFQYALTVLEALSELDIDKYTIVIAYHDHSWTPILDRLGLSGYAMRFAKIGQRIADVAMVLQLSPTFNVLWGRYFNPLVDELRALNCDLWLFPAGETLSYQMPGRTIGAIHDLMHRYESSFPEVSNLFRYRLREHRMGNIARYCSKVLVDSNVGKQHVIESYGVAADKIVPIAYVAPSYLNINIERPDFDSHYSLPPKFLFYPAQFWPHKNHKRLLEAISKLANGDCKDVQLVLSGAKRYKYQEIKNYAESLGVLDRVHFVGYVPDIDLRGFYTRARALVMPSFFGPTNIPPLEALATGCPAVVSGIYGMSEQLGDAALYFNPKSADEISHRIAQIWTDENLFLALRVKGLRRTENNGQLEFNRKFARLISDSFNE